MRFLLSQVAAAMGVSPQVFPEAEVSGWSIDSRTLSPGDIYFALRGPVHDGHQYVAAAFERGAMAAVVDSDVFAAGVLLRVPDSLRALQQLGAWARAQWGGEVIGVTGSAGKTSTKDAIAHLLATELPVGKTVGNFNNNIGLPLSILRLPETASVGVLEMGMNHAGEIRELCGIARPDHGVVTNVGHAHVEFFESIEGVALAKRELIESLAPEGVAFLNADDPRVSEFRQVHANVVTFGFSEQADIRGQELGEGRFLCEGVVFETQLTGRHAISNVLAAIAVAREHGIAAARLHDAVRTLAPGAMRGERLQHEGITILNDCYNSNPAAVRAMVDVLQGVPGRRKIAVLGEMLELGNSTGPLHRETGRYIAGSGMIDVLIGIRGAARYMVEEAVLTGMSGSAAYFFENPDQAGEFLRNLLREGDAVLFKGSRGVHVERALQAVLNVQGVSA